MGEFGINFDSCLRVFNDLVVLIFQIVTYDDF